MENEQYSNRYVVCPYCENKRIPEQGEDYEDYEFEEKCGTCSNTFFVQPESTFSWTTRADCELNSKKHDWKKESETNNLIGTKSNSDENMVYCECAECGCTDFMPICEFKKGRDAG